MTCTLHVAWDGRLAGYDFGPGHPMAPLRLRLTMELAQALGLGRQDGVTVAVPAAATDAELELVHDPAYIAMVRLAGHQAAGGGPSGDLTTRAGLRPVPEPQGRSQRRLATRIQDLQRGKLADVKTCHVLLLGR
jgi:acetoin utilization deacetylase AcuC-like enzyme